MAEKEFILRVRGYVQTLDDLRKVAVGVGANGVPILLSQVANVQLGPEMRRGIAELNGEGETVGGIVVVRYGANAREVIQQVKARLDQAMKALPPDVSYTIAYDRTALIDRAVATLEQKAGRGKHRRRAGLHCVSIAFPQRAGGDHHFADRNSDLVRRDVPAGYQLEYHVVRRHRHRNWRNGRRGDHHDRERAQAHRARTVAAKSHWQIIRNASVEVGPTLFYSLLVITVSFLPVFALQAQEGRLFKPLAYTKTYSMAAAALLSITLAPVLMGYLIRGRIRPEEENPINRFFIRIYHPAIDFVIRWRWAVISYCRASRRVGFLSLESAGHKLSAATAAPDLSRDRQIVSVSKLGLRVHAAALRRRSALHANDVSGNLHDQSARDSAADRPDH